MVWRTAQPGVWGLYSVQKTCLTQLFLFPCAIVNKTNVCTNEESMVLTPFSRIFSDLIYFKFRFKLPLSNVTHTGTQEWKTIVANHPSTQEHDLLLNLNLQFGK